MRHALAVSRDRLSHWLNRRGVTFARCGAGEAWIPGGLHVVTRYRYLKITVYLWRRSVQLERRS